MNVYIKHIDNGSDSLSHYGVKGMKWRKHKYGDLERSFNKAMNGSATSDYDANLSNIVGVHAGVYSKRDVRRKATIARGLRVARKERIPGGGHRKIPSVRALDTIWGRMQGAALNKKNIQKGKKIIEKANKLPIISLNKAISKGKSFFRKSNSSKEYKQELKYNTKKNKW